MFKVQTTGGIAYHADLSELIEDSIPDSPLEDRHDVLCKIVERLVERLPAEERRRVLGDVYPSPKK